MVNKMIQFKDFAPRITDRGPFGGPSEYESFSEVVSAVNQLCLKEVWVDKLETEVFGSLSHAMSLL